MKTSITKQRRKQIIGNFWGNLRLFYIGKIM